MAQRGAPTQRLFSGGEQSPLLSARADLARWQSSLEICENVISMVQGGLTRRSGTADVYAAQDNSKLVEFAFSGDDGYAVEIAPAPGKLRFFRDSGILLNDAETAPYEIASPFSLAQVAVIDTAQTADRMYVACDSAPLQQLQRMANTDWSIGAANVNSGPFVDPNLDKSLYLSTDATGELVQGNIFTLTANGFALFQPGHVGGLFRVHVPDAGKYGVWQNEIAYVIGDITIWNGNWYKCIATFGGKSGEQPPVHLIGTAWDGDITSGSFARKWQYLHSGFGVVKVTAYTDANTVTVQAMTYVPSDLQDGTWRWEEGAWSDYRGYPRHLGFHKKRLYCAGSRSYPTRVWASVIDDYVNYDDSNSDDDKAFWFDLEADSGEVNFPQWLISGKRLAIGTSHNEFTISSADVTKPITPDSADPESDTNEGSAAVLAVKVNNPVFVSKDGKRVHEYAIDPNTGDYVTPDLTVEAEHISGEGAIGIVRLAWLRDPYRLLVGLRSDGLLITGVYRKDQNVIGWHRHPMAGSVLDICRAPSSTGIRQDLWLKVRYVLPAGTVTRIECLQPFFERGDRQSTSAWFVDGGVQYAGPPGTVITNLPAHLVGATLKVRADGQHRPDVVVAADRTVTLDRAASLVTLGHRQHMRVRTLRYDQKLQGRNSRVAALTCDVIRSGPVYACAPPNQLDLLNAAGGATVDSAAPLFTGVLEIPLQSGWSDDGNVEFDIDHTGPFTLRALTPQMQVA